MKIILLILMAFVTSLIAEDRASALIRQGDDLDAAMKTSEALAKYLEAEKITPMDANLLHRIAKQYGESMNDAKTPTERRDFGTKALELSQRAVDADASNPLAHVALAISYGRLAPFLENKRKIAYSKLVKIHAEKALALDDKCELAYHALGAWNYELASFGVIMRALVKLTYGGLPEASYAAAEKYFLKGCELNPRRLANFVELGRTYQKLNKPVEAKVYLDKGIALPSIYRDDEATKERARIALKEL